MTFEYNRLIRWALMGGAFASILAISGCSDLLSTLHLQSKTPAPPAPAVAHVQESPTSNSGTAERDSDALFGGASDPDAKPAPKIDVFGQLDGVQRGPVTTVSENGYTQHTFTTEGGDADVSASPDGKWIAFSSSRHFDRSKIYLQRAGGTSVTQLTGDAAEDAYPAFSPDGRQLAFCSTRSGNWDIYVMDIDGKNIVQVTNSPSQELHPSFSPDGTRLVYCSVGGKNSQWELWTVNLTNNEKKMVGFGLFPSWSPAKDADRIAFQRARQRGSRWFSLWTLDLVDGEARRVTEIAASSNAAIVSPAWSPDGARLTFATIVEPAAGSKASKSARQQDIWTVDGDGSHRERLTDGVGTNLSPFWSVDNRVYFISDRSGADCVWSAKADGNKATQTAHAADKKSTKDSKDAKESTDSKEIKESAKPKPNEEVGSVDTGDGVGQ